MKDKNREPGSWVEIKTTLKDRQILKIIGYRGEMMQCVDDEGRLTTLKPSSTKISRIFQVKPDGKVTEGI